MTQPHKVINIDYRCLKSMKQAARLKSMYENKGYTLISESAGFNSGKLIYKAV